MYSMPQTLLAILEEKELLVNAPDLRLRKELPVSIIAGDSDEISPSRTQVEPLLSKTPQSHVFYEKNAGHSLSHISLETFKTSLNSMTPKTGDRYATA